jgi:NAD(P)H-flavin reductase
MMESRQVHGRSGSPATVFVTGKNAYLPLQVRVVEIIHENQLVKTFRLVFVDEIVQNHFTYQPGQVMMLSVPHCGEAPFSFSSAPDRSDGFSLSIRKTGRLTGALQDIRVDDILAVRGPFGRPFPVDALSGSSLLFTAGGIGMAPLRSVLEFCVHNRADYGDITLLYGCRTPDDFCFRTDLERWAAAGLLELHYTVDEATAQWHGNVGLVTELITGQWIQEKTQALVCGPGIMIRFVVKKLRALGLGDERIFTTLERQMKCGIGICGHCHFNDTMICTDGPVFRVSELPGLENI